MFEQLIKMGGKVWEKGDIKRIYIKGDIVKALIREKYTSFSDFEEGCLKKATTYYDGERFHSDIGTVRVMLNNCNLKCDK
ncbi:hypothetical protein [Seleniivibrio woodruffii]|uniref:hypothetical protein n=1 Tax=Seleniivibrio woodruffii TaxID=1078050 RepID=UPI0024096A01|nr:hypothetical protein [Seleniivibrio woodruffii]